MKKMKKGAKKATAKKPAPKKVAARKSAAKRSAAPAPSAPPRGAAPTAPPRTAAPRASIVSRSDDDDVQGGVLSVVAQVCGVQESEVGSKALSKLTSSCDAVFRGRLASQLNAKWGSLNPRMSSDDISCSDGVDSLTREVTNRLG